MFVEWNFVSEIFNCIYDLLRIKHFPKVEPNSVLIKHCFKIRVIIRLNMELLLKILLRYFTSIFFNFFIEIVQKPKKWVNLPN